ncbi:hypothetical protein BDV32DRAFT_137621 [Aspergillus pseudonomiae]|uniref:Uncharacterized protein n=1 Tax=Aspergillus pseudonomiae TaxID=1506151 RepID=A0A5N6I4C0_9EURO|nr:uncharacterized protein BDV37DRAFT_273054 [Aspergillus pseudonomiae]KAB8261248.1 hypothetical protein BDV32DRAFT_137621 [Aspergillus pseudonomiae]KAE8402134.1 hypothetical protein BDV37DRAFT_273054 [Aspergillus pseudonomiae]
MRSARSLLDEEHENLPPKPKDGNNYLLSRMNGHNAVIGVPWIRPLRLSQRHFPTSGLGCWLGLVEGHRGRLMLRTRGRTFGWETLLLVIRRGVMNKEWQLYAAITVAAYAKDLLRVIHPQTVEETANVLETARDVSRTLYKEDLVVSQLTRPVDKFHEEQKNANLLERLHLHDFNPEQSDALSESEEGTGQWLLVFVAKRKCSGFCLGM